MIHRTALVGILAIGLPLAGCGGGSQPADTAASPQPVAPATTLSAATACTREIPVPIAPAALRQMKWSGDAGRGEGNDPHVIFAVPPSGPVCGVRLRFTLATRDGSPAFFQLFWATPGAEFSETHGSWGAMLEPSAQEQTVVVWTQGDIDRIRIDPANKPVEFKLAEMTLLAPWPSRVGDR